MNVNTWSGQKSKHKPPQFWSTWHLCSLLLALLSNQGLVDVRDHTWESQEKNSSQVWVVFVFLNKVEIPKNAQHHVDMCGGFCVAWPKSVVHVDACVVTQNSHAQAPELTASSDGGLDEGVQLLVSTDGELQVTGGDTLHLEIFRGVARQL